MAILTPVSLFDLSALCIHQTIFSHRLWHHACSPFNLKMLLINSLRLGGKVLHCCHASSDSATLTFLLSVAFFLLAGYWCKPWSWFDERWLCQELTSKSHLVIDCVEWSKCYFDMVTKTSGLEGEKCMKVSQSAVLPWPSVSQYTGSITSLPSMN